ncbi:hypothetical protein PROFUN_15477 [Planoprotostelium fungivorum]|uniref:Uncharacterized protein n=1 Tax=Planoprotostelium fungivorum TaxID=1890364 RepID=A0A2P6MUN9_9EUKA|nr:hypothetical protein PROFUN_15477 [Planoprotostelium fungivorum]
MSTPHYNTLVTNVSNLVTGAQGDPTAEQATTFLQYGETHDEWCGQQNLLPTLLLRAKVIQGPPTPAGALRASQALARIAAALGFVLVASFSFPKDGIPPLGASRCTKSTSVSSHIGVTITEGLFNITKGLSKEESTAIWTIYNTQYKEMNYGSENDITIYVCIVMTDVLKSLGLSDIEILSGVSVYELRPDLYAITRKGLPVGVFEVKKPPLGGGKEPMDDQAVHVVNSGQLTTYKKWRVFWLSDCDTAAAAPVTSSNANIPVQLNNQLNEETEEFTEENQDAQDIFDFKDSEGIQGRYSRIFEWNNKELPDLLLTTMAKMSQTRVDSNNLSEDKRKYIVLTKEISCSNIKMSRLPSTYTSKFVLLEDLGYGRDGRTWLGCSQTGSVCVVKFLHGPTSMTTDQKEKLLRGQKLGAGLQYLSSSDCNKWNSCINYAIYLRAIIWQAKELSIQTFDQLIGNLSHQAESPHSKDLLVMINCQGGYQSSLTLVMTGLRPCIEIYEDFLNFRNNLTATWQYQHWHLLIH